jgi:hypothetical protein
VVRNDGPMYAHVVSSGWESSSPTACVRPWAKRQETRPQRSQTAERGGRGDSPMQLRCRRTWNGRQWEAGRHAGRADDRSDSRTDDITSRLSAGCRKLVDLIDMTPLFSETPSGWVELLVGFMRRWGLWVLRWR